MFHALTEATNPCWKLELTLYKSFYQGKWEATQWCPLAPVQKTQTHTHIHRRTSYL